MFAAQCLACSERLCVGVTAPLCALCEAATVTAGRWRRAQEHEPGLPTAGTWCYGGPIATAITAFKWGGVVPDVEAVGAAMTGLLRQRAGTGPCRIVPIGPQLERLRRRGFHLPDLLAKAMCDGALRIETILHRLDRQPTRSLRSPHEPVFAVSRRGRGTTVWLVDDVVTTGRTLSRAAEALECAGWSVAGAVCLCDARPAILWRCERRAMEDQLASSIPETRQPI